VLEGVAIAAGVHAPASVVVTDPALNSCSVGRRPEDATIVVTSGLKGALSRDELEAVLAYELSRVSSFDTALSTWTAAVTGRTIEISQETDRIMVQLALLIPVRLARRLRARTLRRQAGQRDILALSFTRHPEALLSALEKIDADETPVTAVGAAAAPLWLKWPLPDPRESQGALDLGGRIEELRALVAA
jgi:heat shock protein HtpX